MHYADTDAVIGPSGARALRGDYIEPGRWPLPRASAWRRLWVTGGKPQNEHLSPGCPAI